MFMQWALWSVLITHSRNYYLRGINSEYVTSVTLATYNSVMMYVWWHVCLCLFSWKWVTFQERCNILSSIYILIFSQLFPIPYNFLCAVQGDMIWNVFFFSIFISYWFIILGNIYYNTVNISLCVHKLIFFKAFIYLD